MQLHMCMCMHTCTCVQAHACTHTHLGVCECTHMHTYVHTYVHTCVCTYVQAHMHTHLWAPTCTQAHAHETPSQNQDPMHLGIIRGPKGPLMLARCMCSTINPSHPKSGVKVIEAPITQRHVPSLGPAFGCKHPHLCTELAHPHMHTCIHVYRTYNHHNYDSII